MSEFRLELLPESPLYRAELRATAGVYRASSPTAGDRRCPPGASGGHIPRIPSVCAQYLHCAPDPPTPLMAAQPPLCIRILSPFEPAGRRLSPAVGPATRPLSRRARSVPIRSGAAYLDVPTAADQRGALLLSTRPPSGEPFLRRNSAQTDKIAPCRERRGCVASAASAAGAAGRAGAFCDCFRDWTRQSPDCDIAHEG